jgi:hypothetical protein
MGVINMSNLKGRKRVYVGYDKERKVRNREEKEIIRGMYYYAIDNPFSKQNNKIPVECEKRPATNQRMPFV